MLTGWRQGDVFELDDSMWVVVSRSCDIIRGADTVDAVYCAPISRQTDSRILTGRRPRWLPVKDFGDGTWCGDMQQLRRFRKEELKDCSHDCGCATAEHERMFRRQAGRFFGRPSHIDALEKTLEPLSQRISKRHGKGSSEGALTRVITDLRIVTTPNDLDPHDEDTPRELLLLVVVEPSEMLVERTDESISDHTRSRRQTASTDPSAIDGMHDELAAIAYLWSTAFKTQKEGEIGSREWLFREYVKLLVSGCNPVGPLTEVRFEIVSEDNFSFNRVKDSSPLGIENLSFDSDT